MSHINRILFIIFITTIIHAQEGSSPGTTDPISAGMGNSSITNARGIYAIGKNPANLIFSPDSEIELSTIIPVPNINVFGGSNFITLNDYNYYFGGTRNSDGEIVGRLLTDQDKNNLQSLFEKGGHVAFDLSTTYLAFTYKISPETGAIGFSTSDYVSTYVNLPGSIINLAFEGNPSGRLYNFSGSDFKASWLRSYSLSYSRDFNDLFQTDFENFGIGITLKYVQGMGVVQIDHVSTSVTTDESYNIITEGKVMGYSSFSESFGLKYNFDKSNDKSEGSFSPFPSPAGQGFGVDLGVALRINELWAAGLSVTDIGKIKWTKNVAEFSSNHALVIDDITDSEKLDSVFNTITSEGKIVNEFTSSLPTALRIGFSFQLDKSEIISSFPGSLLLTFDYNQGIVNQTRNSNKPRFSIGAEWLPGELIPIRTGFSFGGRDGLGWALGTGLNLGIFEFSIAATNFANWLKVNDSQKLSVSIGSRWRF